MILKIKSSKSVVKYLLILLAGILLTGKTLDTLYPLAAIKDPSRYSRIIVDEKDRLLRAFPDANGVWRHPIDLHQVSQNYLEALIAYEDQWYWYHPGINPFSFFRALLQNIGCQCIRSGASTITMQVARIFYPHERTITGKLSQVLRAFQIEWHYSKEQILKLYINNAPYGGTIEGLQAASQSYLGKSADELTDAEAALLTVLPQAPSRNRPDRYPQRAEQARDKVLNRLQNNGVWNKQRIKQAKQEGVVAYTPDRPLHAPLLARHLLDTHPKKQVIKTTINMDMQYSIQSFVKDQSALLPKRSSMAVIVVDNEQHHIKTYVGSANINDSMRFGYVDMVRATRSPGSALKPFIYATAIEAGLIHSHSLLIDTPRYNSEYRPENFDGSFNGAVSATRALQQSLNLPAVQVLEALGEHTFYARLKNAGVKLSVPGEPNLSLALGGAGTSLLDMVTLYSSFANDGFVTPLKVIADDSTNSKRYLTSKEAAWITYKMLASSNRPDRINNPLFSNRTNPIAWKTGTSYGYRDSWAFGTTEKYTIGVWVGRPDGTPLPGHYGAITAAPVLFKVFSMIPNNLKAVPQPNTVSKQEICWPLGTLKSQTESHHCHKEHLAWVASDTVPPTLQEPGIKQWWPNPLPIWVNPENNKAVHQGCKIAAKPIKKQIALWPRAAEPWIPLQYRFYRQIPRTDQSCAIPPRYNVRPLSITNLDSGNQFQLGNEKDPLLLNVSIVGGSGEIQWYLNGHFLDISQPGHRFPVTIQKRGRHQLLALDQDGNMDRVEFIVH